MDLTKAAKFSQKIKDVVNGFVKEVQDQFPGDNPYYNIVDLVKLLIIFYYRQVLESKLLDNKYKR